MSYERKFYVHDIVWDPDDLPFDSGDAYLFENEYPSSVEIEIETGYDDRSSIEDYLHEEYDAKPIDFDFEEIFDNDEYDDDNNEEHVNEYGEFISVGDAAEIWLSNGKDEDYMFGYSEEELEDALNN